MRFRRRRGGRARARGRRRFRAVARRGRHSRVRRGSRLLKIGYRM